VYAVFWDGASLAMHAYDFAGKPVWKHDLGSFAGGTTGAGTSPVVYGGLVYLNHDQDKFKDGEEEKSGFPGRTAEVIAVDARTGKLVWRAPRATFQCSYSTPFLHHDAIGKAELIVASTAGLAGYDPKTGIENWKWVWTFRVQPRRTVASPVLAHGLVFASCGSGDGERHLIAVRKPDKGDVTSTNLVWQNRKGYLPYVPTLLAWGDHLYFAGDGGIAGCLDAKTGAEIWTERLGTGSINASPIQIDGNVYVATEEGDVYVYRAAPAFKLLAKNSLGEGVRATPAVSNGRLFIRGERRLCCIAKPAWR
jgi:outer membrane protein assembly factor BamB